MSLTSIILGLGFVGVCWMLYEIKNAPVIIDTYSNIDTLLAARRAIEDKILFQQYTMSNEEYDEAVNHFWTLDSAIRDYEEGFEIYQD